MVEYENGERVKKPFFIKCGRCGKQSNIELELIRDYDVTGNRTETGCSWTTRDRLAFRITCRHCKNTFDYWIESAEFPQIVELFKKK